MNDTLYSGATEFIIRQQFHRDNNLIVDRTGERKIVIPGADNVIEAIIKTINSETHLWETGKKELFLERVSVLLGLSSDAVIDKAIQKLEALAETDASSVVEYMTATGVVFSLFREMVNNNLVKQIVQNYPAIAANQEQLRDRLVMDESLLANMAVLDRLAVITDKTIPREIIQKETKAVVRRIMRK
ncbi:MAG: hypothetical protein ACFFD4_05435 [Candidatus Odinarchaeota archaeon]